MGGICGDGRYNMNNSNCFCASDIRYSSINEKSGVYNGNEDYTINTMKTKIFCEKLNEYEKVWLGSDGHYPIVKGAYNESEYFTTEISSIRSNSVELFANCDVVLGQKLKSWGFLLSLDDGKETFIACIKNKNSAKVTNLESNRNYKVRWYAQDIDGKEYYGVENKFKTKTLNPETLEANNIGVSSVTLSGECFIEEKEVVGFYIEEKGIESGTFSWLEEKQNSRFSLVIDNLKGNTTYEYKSILLKDSIYYEGDTKEFTTLVIETLEPSNFKRGTIDLNGEVGIDTDKLYFELRNSSLPSVIDSEKYDASRQGVKVTCRVENLEIGETYKCRLVAEAEDEIYFGDWITFNYNEESSIQDINVSKDIFKIDDDMIVALIESELCVYDICGNIVGFGKTVYVNPGIYIIKCGNVVKKVVIK